MWRVGFISGLCLRGVGGQCLSTKIKGGGKYELCNDVLKVPGGGGGRAP